MVNISSNINTQKESLSSGGRQFYQFQQNKGKFKQWWSTFPQISTKQEKVLNSDGQQFHQYQTNREIQTMMVDNSSIINKTKEILDSDVNISTNMNKTQ